MDFNKKRTWAEISLENIKHNYESIRKELPDGCKFLGVVKADAYGHGAVRVAKLLQDCGADYLAVACLDEGIELRENGITMPILILGHTPTEFTKYLIDYNITQAVSCLEYAKEFSNEATKLGKELKIHVKIDSGMGRLGFICAGDSFTKGVEEVYEACQLPGLVHEGIFTHFAVSDEEGAVNRNFTHDQFKLFMDMINALKEKGIEFEIRHCANSGAVVSYPEVFLDMVRPGLLLYGYGDTSGRLGLKPCMSLYTTVSALKTYKKDVSISYGRLFTTDQTTKVAVLSIGYADGLPRIASGKFKFYSEYGLARQVGRICMDMCMVNVNHFVEIKVGDRFEIFGEHADLNIQSKKAQTIPYEFMCGITKRVPRIYI